MANILFVHNNFPAQFRFLTAALVSKGHRCVAIGSVKAPGLPNVPIARWKARRGSTKGIFPPASRTEATMIQGEAALVAAREIKQQGFKPDLIIAHPGWGESLFLRKVFPKAVVIAYAEYYHKSGGVVGFDPFFGEASLEDEVMDQARNAPLALAYADADVLVCATRFQADLLPTGLRSKAVVVHEGIDTTEIRPRPNAVFRLADGRQITRDTPVITFVNRNFEPLRGFHVFMRALPKLLDTVPNAEILLIGNADKNGYGKPAPNDGTWREAMLSELSGKLDLGRVHFVGRIPHGQMLDAMAIGAAHVYFTYPFTSSWSFLEAMASECLVIGSDTAPVTEFLKHGSNGVVVPFAEPDTLADAMIDACRRPDAYASLRKAARETILSTIDRATLCLPEWEKLVNLALAGTAGQSGGHA